MNQSFYCIAITKSLVGFQLQPQVSDQMLKHVFLKACITVTMDKKFKFIEESIYSFVTSFISLYIATTCFIPKLVCLTD